MVRRASRAAAPLLRLAVLHHAHAVLMDVHVAPGRLRVLARHLRALAQRVLAWIADLPPRGRDLGAGAVGVARMVAADSRTAAGGLRVGGAGRRIELRGVFADTLTLREGRRADDGRKRCPRD